jgi:DNA polymerase I
MANVRTAKKMIELGYEFIPGMKVSWIVTDSSRTPQEIEPYISGTEFKGIPDRKYYAERLANMASRVTEVFGWSEKDLMMGSQQATLFGDLHTASIKKDAQPAPAKKNEQKRTSLKDFF